MMTSHSSVANMIVKLPALPADILVASLTPVCYTRGR